MKTKRCTRCDTTKSVDDFSKNKTRKDGLQTCCKECRKTIDKESYINSQSRRNSIRERNKVITSYNRNLITRYKGRYGCSVCEESEPIALDLHHVDPKSKENNPSSMVSWSTNKLRAEIRKCVILCANCHRKVHAGIIKL